MNNKKKYSKYSVNIVPVGRKLKREVSVSEFAKALTNEQLFYVVETWFNNLMRQGWKEGLELGEHLSADHPTIQGVIVNAIAAIVTVMPETIGRLNFVRKWQSVFGTISFNRLSREMNNDNRQTIRSVW